MRPAAHRGMVWMESLENQRGTNLALLWTSTPLVDSQRQRSARCLQLMDGYEHRYSLIDWTQLPRPIQHATTQPASQAGYCVHEEEPAVIYHPSAHLWPSFMAVLLFDGLSSFLPAAMTFLLQYKPGAVSMRGFQVIFTTQWPQTQGRLPARMSATGGAAAAVLGC